MSITKPRGELIAGASGVPEVDLKLEALAIPVADVDRAKEFYTKRPGISRHGSGTPLHSGKWASIQAKPSTKRSVADVRFRVRSGHRHPLEEPRQSSLTS
jgi:hypothetical protein